MSLAETMDSANMNISLVQFRDRNGRGVAVADRSGQWQRVPGFVTVLDLASHVLASGIAIADWLVTHRSDEAIDLASVELLLPVDHMDPARLMVSGTGLTHSGSAAGRDAMHRSGTAGEQLTDSIRMFRMGEAGGKPPEGVIGVQPEWFYKGDGRCLVASGQPLESPAFALDGSEEPEIAAIYLIDADRQPVRLGYALGNEFSDHVTERENYLWLAHSKLRPASLGPELLLGPLPSSVSGISRIRRDGEVIWEKQFYSGEANMSHSLANLEYHHFKYAQFRRPGDVHVHFMGTAVLSYGSEVNTRDGDVFEISADAFDLELSNCLTTSSAKAFAVRDIVTPTAGMSVIPLSLLRT